MGATHSESKCNISKVQAVNKEGQVCSQGTDIKTSAVAEHTLMEWEWGGH